jgi:hypothetical protein
VDKRNSQHILDICKDRSWTLIFAIVMGAIFTLVGTVVINPMQSEQLARAKAKFCKVADIDPLVLDDPMEWVQYKFEDAIESSSPNLAELEKY